MDSMDSGLLISILKEITQTLNWIAVFLFCIAVAQCV